MRRRHIPILEFYSRLSRSYDISVESGLFSDPETIFKAAQSFITPSMKTMLDVGIGSGLSALPFRKAGLDVTGIDGSPEMLALCRTKNIASSLLQMDFEEAAALPFDDRRFDITHSHATLYMVWEAETVLKEMIRVTKPGGLVAFNYEPAPHDFLEVRQNDGGMDSSHNFCSVNTYLFPETDIKGIFKKAGLPLLYAQTAPAMEKMDGSMISFQTLVYQKPFSL